MKKYKGMLIISFSVLVLAVIVAWAIFRTKPDIPVQRSSVNVGISNEAKDKKINELVASLISAYNEQQKTGHRPDADTVKNRPLTMVFMNVKYNGINDSDKDYILAKIADHLQGSKKMQIVEREVMEKLLEELKLSSSNLTDPSTALRVGKILSARLISTGNILRAGNDWQINLRMIETETTLVKAAITETISAENKDEVAERLSRDILNKIAEEYK
ncbi:MAG: hypothetical protein HY758_04395 [Nitrospirae bacterium]|nr:hypothetical protein [Nitrospirota bacterium]